MSESIEKTMYFGIATMLVGIITGAATGTAGWVMGVGVDRLAFGDEFWSEGVFRKLFGAVAFGGGVCYGVGSMVLGAAKRGLK